MRRNRWIALLCAVVLLAVLALGCTDISGIDYDARATATASVRMEAVMTATREAGR